MIDDDSASLSYFNEARKIDDEERGASNPSLWNTVPKRKRRRKMTIDGYGQFAIGDVGRIPFESIPRDATSQLKPVEKNFSLINELWVVLKYETNCLRLLGPRSSSLLFLVCVLSYSSYFSHSFGGKTSRGCPHSLVRGLCCGGRR